LKKWVTLLLALGHRSAWSVDGIDQAARSVSLFSDQTDPVTVMRAIFDLQPNGVKISKLAYLMRNSDK
jgi:hypothetical protein